MRKHGGRARTRRIPHVRVTQRFMSQQRYECLWRMSVGSLSPFLADFVARCGVGNVPRLAILQKLTENQSVVEFTPATNLGESIE